MTAHSAEVEKLAQFGGYLARFLGACVIAIGVLMNAGCVTMPGAHSFTQKTAAKPAPPSWYLNQPANSASALYGKGTGASRQDAVNEALAEIAAGLRVTIKAETKQRRTYSGGQEAMSSDEQIEASVNAIDFTQYDVAQSAETGGTHWVHVRVAKAALAKDLDQQIQEQKRALDLAFQRFLAASALAQSREIPELEAQLDQLEANAISLATLTDYDRSTITRYTANHKDKLERARRNMVVKIEHGRHTGLFARKLEELLTQRDIKVVNGGSRSGKTVLSVKSEVKQQRYGSAYISVVNLKVQAMDERGKVLNTYVKTLNGASPTNYDASLRQANLKLFEAFVDDDVLNTSGL